jgi:hypothetical protein
MTECSCECRGPNSVVRTTADALSQVWRDLPAARQDAVAFMITAILPSSSRRTRLREATPVLLYMVVRPP